RFCRGRHRVPCRKLSWNARAESSSPPASRSVEMANFEPMKQRRGLVAIDGAMALIVILLVVQIWLLSATLKAFLADDCGPVVPAAIFSGLLFLAALTLNVFVNHIDDSSRRP